MRLILYPRNPKKREPETDGLRCALQGAFLGALLTALALAPLFWWLGTQWGR